MKKIWTWGGLAFLLFFIATRPNDAANVVGSIGGGLRAIAVGMGEFVTSIG